MSINDLPNFGQQPTPTGTPTSPSTPLTPLPAPIINPGSANVQGTWQYPVHDGDPTAPTQITGPSSPGQ
jgi:hypothetical protein